MTDSIACDHSVQGFLTSRLFTGLIKRKVEPEKDHFCSPVSDGEKEDDKVGPSNSTCDCVNNTIR